MPPSPHITNKNNLIQCTNFTMEESDLLQIKIKRDEYFSLFMSYFQVLPKMGMKSSSIGKHFVAFIFLASFVDRIASRLGSDQYNLLVILLVECGNMYALLIDRIDITFLPPLFFSALNVDLIPTGVTATILQL